MQKDSVKDVFKNMWPLTNTFRTSYNYFYIKIFLYYIMFPYFMRNTT
jgi:hypothetical protein